MPTESKEPPPTATTVSLHSSEMQTVTPTTASCEMRILYIICKNRTSVHLHLFLQSCTASRTSTLAPLPLCRAAVRAPTGCRSIPNGWALGRSGLGSNGSDGSWVLALMMVPEAKANFDVSFASLPCTPAGTIDVEAEWVWRNHCFVFSLVDHLQILYCTAAYVDVQHFTCYVLCRAGAGSCWEVGAMRNNLFVFFLSFFFFFLFFFFFGNST